MNIVQVEISDGYKFRGFHSFEKLYTGMKTTIILWFTSSFWTICEICTSHNNPLSTKITFVLFHTRLHCAIHSNQY